jgi:hypothetical protein
LLLKRQQQPLQLHLASLRIITEHSQKLSQKGNGLFGVNVITIADNRQVTAFCKFLLAL